MCIQTFTRRKSQFEPARCRIHDPATFDGLAGPPTPRRQAGGAAKPQAKWILALNLMLITLLPPGRAWKFFGAEIKSGPG